MRQRQIRQGANQITWVRAMCTGLGAGFATFLGGMLASPSFIASAQSQGIPLPGVVEWYVGSFNICPIIFAVVGALVGYSIGVIIQRGIAWQRSSSNG